MLGCHYRTQRSTLPLQHHGLAPHELRPSYWSSHLLLPLVLYMMPYLQKCLLCIHHWCAQPGNTLGLCLTAKTKRISCMDHSMHAELHRKASSIIMWLQEWQHRPNPECTHFRHLQECLSSRSNVHGQLVVRYALCDVLCMYLVVTNACGTTQDIMS